MKLKRKPNFRRFAKYWEKEGKKDLFTWLHRYLRLHSELLEDSVYQDMYNYYRNKLIEDLRKEIKAKESDNARLGEAIDALADFFNKSSAERVDKYQLLVEELHTFLEKNSEIIKSVLR